MAVFRIEKTRDYTVMSNYHLRDKMCIRDSSHPVLPAPLPGDWGT